MATCPLIDYLAWVPFALAGIAATLAATAGVVRRSRATLARAVDVFAALIVGGSVVSAVAIIGLEGSC